MKYFGARLLWLTLACLPASAVLAQAPTPMQLEVHLTYGQTVAGDAFGVAVQEHVPTGRLVLGGVLGWAVGSIGGGFLGASRSTDDFSNFDDLGNVLLGFTLGGGIGTALGTHWANKSQGRVVLNAVLTTLVQFGNLVFVAYLSDKMGTDGDWALVALPIIPVAFSVMIERSTSD